MADILKITTPIVDRSAVTANRAVADPSIPFQLSDVSKVIKPEEQSALLQQYNGMPERDSSATILMNLLKDPSVTVSFLKNIDMLQEIIKLLPVNNQALTTEIEQLFNTLLISPDDIVAELLSQEQASTAFKGDLFDFLRQLMAENAKPEMRYGISNLLKSLNGLESREKILNSLANSLSFLADSFSSSASLSQKLSELSAQFRASDAEEHFLSLKDQTLQLLKEVKDSILYTPKLHKVVPMIIYNLSRFSDNPNYLKECVASLSTIIDGNEKKEQLITLLNGYTNNPETAKGRSQVMQVLAQIIGKENEISELSLLGSEKIEKIIHSLLSSPCNFTPLLHYIIPVEDEYLRAFAEIWIDPSAESFDAKGNVVTDCIHMLMVFDIEGIGTFEAELAASGKDIMVNLYCPASYLPAFSSMASSVREQMASTGYKLLNLSVDRLERQRSLMDVFKTLPHKRTGVDVKI